MWVIEENSSMKVFSKLFVGIQKKNGAEDVPLAFATPYEGNAACRKRQETVINWLGGRRQRVVKNGRYTDEYEDVELNTPILDNVPREGFKITDDVKRVYWGGGNVVWRVEDPYGFELEIQSQNLMAIIQCAGISAGGRILGKCLWGRSGKDNILLHETSEEYKNAVKAAETVKPPPKVRKAERKPGSIYKVATGLGMLYVGKVYVTNLLYGEPSQNRSVLNATHLTAAGTHTFCEKKILIGQSELYEACMDVSKKEDGTIELGTSLKLYKSAPLTDLMVEDYVTEHLMDDEWLSNYPGSFAAAGKDWKIVRIGAITRQPFKDPVFKLAKLTPIQTKEILNHHSFNKSYHGGKKAVGLADVSYALKMYQAENVIVKDRVYTDAHNTDDDNSQRKDTGDCILLPSVIEENVLTWRDFGQFPDFRRYHYYGSNFEKSDIQPGRATGYATLDELKKVVSSMIQAGEIQRITLIERQ